MQSKETAALSPLASGKTLSAAHRAQFTAVRDSRNRRVPGLYIRNGRYYGQLWVDRGNGKKTARRFPLLNDSGKPAGTLAEAKQAFEIKRHERRENALPSAGCKPSARTTARHISRKRRCSANAPARSKTSGKPSRAGASILRTCGLKPAKRKKAIPNKKAETCAPLPKLRTLLRHGRVAIGEERSATEKRVAQVNRRVASSSDHGSARQLKIGGTGVPAHPRRARRNPRSRVKIELR